MCSLSVNDLPYNAGQPLFLTIKRIELFVIPALAVDAAGFRVCLRLTSKHGYGWSERFVPESEQFLDLQRWSSQLEAFIGRFPLSFLAEPLIDNADPDSLAYSMVIQAVNQASKQTISTATVASPTEEAVLRKRAIAYISVD